MKRRKFFTIVGSLCLMVVIAALPFMAACAAPAPTPTPTPTPTPIPTPAPVPEKVIELKYQGGAYSTMHPIYYDAFNVWARELEKRTQGRVAVTLFPQQTLVTNKESWDAIRSGVVDICINWWPFFKGVFPLHEVWYQPFMGPTSSIVSPAIWRLTQETPEMQEEWKEVHMITKYASAVHNLHSTKKLIKTLEDFEGMSLGAPTPMELNLIRALGGNPSRFTVTPDTYLALQRGILEGGIWPWAPLRSQQLTEFLIYHTVCDFGYAAGSHNMNKELWESLPGDIQSVIDEISGETYAALLGLTLSQGSQVDIQWMKGKGDEFYTLPPDERLRLIKVAEPIAAEWLKLAEAAGVDGEALRARAHQIVSEIEENPIPPEDWFGYAGQYGSPNRPGGWD